MMENTSGTLHQLLKMQTMALHEKAHKIPYISNLLNNNIQIESYVGHLKALAIIYGTLERQFKISNNTDLSVFIEHYNLKLPMLLEDLENLSSREFKDIMPAVTIALQIADKIILNIDKPLRLLGYLYTLEGSLNGGSVFIKHLTEIFELTEEKGLSYFASYHHQFNSFWNKFTSRLNDQIIDDQSKQEVLSGAQEIFNDICAIYEQLYPVRDQSLGYHVTSLNPEAGNYPVTTNPVEIEAAITAGMKCWIEFPFFEKRYKERGRRFAVSDSAWLVSLCELSAANSAMQALWLAKFLAIKGMPIYTMEIQLLYLHSELKKQFPGNESRYENLSIASEFLRRLRFKRLHPEIFEKSNSIFYNNYMKLEVKDDYLENTGKLIASSISDERNGIKESSQNFRNWITHPEIFSENWISAVNITYQEISNHQLS